MWSQSSSHPSAKCVRTSKMATTDDIILKVLFSLLIGMNVLGNTLVVLVVILHRTMQTPMNYLLTNLAVADLLFGIFIIPVRPFNQEFTQPGGWEGDLLCKVLTYGNLAWLSSVTSVMTLMLISWERYHAILHPYKAGRRMTKGRLRKLIISAWISSAIFLVPETWHIRFDEKKDRCIYNFPIWLLKTDAVLWLTMIGLLPLGVMGVSYGRVVQRLWFRRERTANVSQRSLLQSRKRVTKTVLSVTVILGCCWFPNLIWYFLDSFSLISSVPKFHAVSHVFIMLNTTVNPIIYATRDKRFRRHMWRLVTKRCIRSRNNLVGDVQNVYESASFPMEGLILRNNGRTTISPNSEGKK